MKKKLLGLLFGSALVLAACGGGGAEEAPSDTEGGDTTGGETAQTGDASAAQALYEGSCASCHGGNLEGGVGPELTAVGANLDQAKILDIIENGQGNMPAGLLQGDDAAQVAEWLAGHK